MFNNFVVQPAIVERHAGQGLTMRQAAIAASTDLHADLLRSASHGHPHPRPDWHYVRTSIPYRNNQKRLKPFASLALFCLFIGIN